MVIYTDGSCQHLTHKGGWGVVITKDDGTLITEGNGSVPNTTNNRMELTAVIMAIRQIKPQPVRKSITVVTDSRYVQTGIENFRDWISRNMHTAGGTEVKNKDLWFELIQELKQRNLFMVVQKIEGHSGHPMNERADKLAKSARSKA